jgi:hypothetical protein
MHAHVIILDKYLLADDNIRQEQKGGLEWPENS